MTQRYSTSLDLIPQSRTAGSPLVSTMSLDVRKLTGPHAPQDLHDGQLETCRFCEASVLAENLGAHGDWHRTLGLHGASCALMKRTVIDTDAPIQWIDCNVNKPIFCDCGLLPGAAVA